MALSSIPMRKPPPDGTSSLYTDFTREGRRPELWCRIYFKDWEAYEYRRSGRHAYAHHRCTRRNRALCPNRRLYRRGQDARRRAGGSFASVNPAHTDETVAEVLLGDAGTFVAACRAAREAQRSGPPCRPRSALGSSRR